MLLILFLTTVLPGSISGIETVFGDGVSADLCSLPDGVFPYPDNCTVFIRCQSGAPDIELCSDGLLFNSLKLTCDHSITGNCSSYEDFDMTTGMVETSDVTCSEDGPNIYPIQSNCSEYYMCENDKAFKVQCPTGLLMNAEKLTCDYPENVKCDIASSVNSVVEIKAIYEDESELKTDDSIAYSSTGSSTETTVPVMTETVFNSEEASADNSLTSLDRNLYTSLNVIEQSSSDNSTLNEEKASTLSIDDNLTNEKSNIETTMEEKKDRDEIFPGFSLPTKSIQTVEEIAMTTSDDQNNQYLSTFDPDTEKSNLNPSSEVIITSDFKTSTSDTVLTTDPTLSLFHDFETHESSELDSVDKSASVSQNSDTDIIEIGSGSDFDTADIFTITSSKASEQTITNVPVDISEYASTTNTPFTTFDDYNLSAENMSIVEEAMSTDLENESTLVFVKDSDLTTNAIENFSEDVAKNHTELTNSEIFSSSSQTLTSEINLADDSTKTDHINSSVKTTVFIESDLSLNESTVASDVSTSVNSLENEDELYLQVSTENIVKETDSITPALTVSTSQALMSSDPHTDNETMKSTQDYSEITEVTQKYFTDKSIATPTVGYQSLDIEIAETGENEALSDSQTKEYEDSTELADKNTIRVTAFDFPVVTSTSRNDYFASSKSNAESTSEVSVEISEINDYFMRTVSNTEIEFENKFSTSRSKSSSDFTSTSSLTNEIINVETVTIPEYTASEHTTESDVNVIDSNVTSVAHDFPTEAKTSTSDTISTAHHSSTDLEETQDSDALDSSITHTNIDENETPVQSFSKNQSEVSTRTNFDFSNEDFTTSSILSSSSTNPLVIDIDNNDFTTKSQSPAVTSLIIDTLETSPTATNSILSFSSTEKSAGVTDVTFAMSPDLSDSTKQSSTRENLGTADTFSDFTDNNSRNIGMTNLEIQPTEKFTETIDLSSENMNAVTDETYSDPTSSLSNSFVTTDESLIPSTTDLGSLIDDSNTFSVSDIMKLTTNEDEASSSETPLNIVTQSFNDLTTGNMIQNETEFIGTSINEQPLTVKNENSNESEDFPINTHSTRKETSLPIEIQNSNLIETSTNLPNTVALSSLPPASITHNHFLEEASGLSESVTYTNEITSTLDVMSEYTERPEIKSTVMKTVVENLSETTTELIRSVSNKVNEETSPFSTGENGNDFFNTETTLSNSIKVFETTSESIKPEIVTHLEPTLNLSKVTEDLKHISTTESNVLQTNSDEKITETINPSEISEGGNNHSDLSTLGIMSTNLSILDVETDGYVTTQEETNTHVDEKLVTDTNFGFQTESFSMAGDITENIHISTSPNNSITNSESVSESTTDFSVKTSKNMFETKAFFPATSTNLFETENAFQTTTLDDFKTSDTKSYNNTTDVTFITITNSSAISENANFSDKYEVSQASEEDSDLPENISIDSDSTLQNSNSTSVPFQIKSESTEYSSKYISDISTTVSNLFSVTNVSTVASEEITMNNVKTDLTDETSYIGNSSDMTIINSDYISESTTYFNTISEDKLDAESTFPVQSSNLSNTENVFETTSVDSFKTSESINYNSTNISFTYIANNSVTYEDTEIVESASIITDSSLLQNTIETSEPLNPETQSTEYSRKDVFDTNTTVFDSISITTVPSVVSEEIVMNNVTTEFIGEESQADNSNTTSYFSDLFESTTDIPKITKQNDEISVTPLQFVTSAQWKSNISSVSTSTLPETYWNDSSIDSTELQSQSIEDINKTSTFTATSTKDPYLSENPTITEKNEDVTSAGEYIQMNNSTEQISTKLYSEDENSFETSKFTSQKFEESTSNIYTTSEFDFKTTVNSEWPAKFNTSNEIASLSSTNTKQPTTDFTSIFSTETTIKLSDSNFTQTTVNDEVFEAENISENSLFQSTDNFISTDSLNENTTFPFYGSKITYEDTSEPHSSTMDSMKMFPTSTYEFTQSITNFELGVANASTTEATIDFSETNSMDLVNKVQPTTDFISETVTGMPRNYTDYTLLTDFSDSSITTTENDFQELSKTTDISVDIENITTTYLNSIVNTTNKIIPDNTEEKNEYELLSTDFSVSQNTATQSSAFTSKAISGNDLQTIPTTETSILINTADLMNTDDSAFSFASRNINERTEDSTEQSTSTYFPETLRTKESRSTEDIVTDSEHERVPSSDNYLEDTTTVRVISTTIARTENVSDVSKVATPSILTSRNSDVITTETILENTQKENEFTFSITDFSVSQNNAIQTSELTSKDIPESDLQTISTAEAEFLSISDTSSESINTDYFSASITGENMKERTEDATKETTSTYETLTTKESQSTLDIVTESEHQRVTSPVSSLEDTTTIQVISDRTQDASDDSKVSTSSILTSRNSDVITSETILENTEEKSEFAFSTTDFSVSRNTAIKTSAFTSKAISENDLQTIPTTDTSILSITAGLMNTDYSDIPFASRNINERTEDSTEHSTLIYFPETLRTKESQPTLDIVTESEHQRVTSPVNSLEDTTTVQVLATTADRTEDASDDSKVSTSSILTSRNLDDITSETIIENTEEKSEFTFSTTDLSVSQNIAIQTSELTSKDIPEIHLQTLPTTETEFLSISDTISESINTDYSSASITSRNLNEGTLETSSTDFPGSLETENQSALNITESEHHIFPSPDNLEITSTVNTICETSDDKFPYQKDCSKFYHCTKGVPKLASCVGDEHFDPVKKICANPCVAKCDPNADCKTTESITTVKELTSQTTLTKELFPSTSQSFTSKTKETSYTNTPEYSTKNENLDELSKSTFEETSEITILIPRTLTPETTLRDLTDSLTSRKLSTTTTNNDVTEESKVTVSDSRMNSTFTEMVTTALDSNVTDSTSTPIASTIAITTLSHETTQTEVQDFSTVSSTESDNETPSPEPEITKDMSSTSFSSDMGSGDDASDKITSWSTSTKCDNNDCHLSNLTSSESPVPFKLCPRNDFLSLSNCDHYLDCTGKTPVEMECTVGLHFNPTTRVCDWPYNAECGNMPNPLYEPADFKCPCETCLIPSTTSCSQYYLCLGFIAYEMQCSYNLYFDRNLNTCNYAPLVDCHEPTSTSTTEEIEPTERSTEVSTRIISKSTTWAPSTAPTPFVCPSREGLFRHPGSCAMFYQCSNRYPYEMHCAAGTHFSELTKRCEFPCDAKCDLTLNCGSSSTASPSDRRCSCRNCKLPSSETCTKYIVCVNGRARIENCPWGQTFDSKRSTCDWAHKVSCHNSAMCPERNGIFSHKDDCHKYIHCSNGIPNEKDCPSILEFDPVKKRCEWPTGRCSRAMAKELNTFKNEEHRRGWRCPKKFGFFSDDQHCNKFYHCSFGTPALKECSTGLLYNPKLQTCDWKKHVRCNSNRHRKPRKCRVFDHHVVCSEERIPQPHTLCNMYYDCTAGRACAKQCPVGLFFNNMTGVCDLPENVKCFNPGKEDYSLKELSLKCASGGNERKVNPANDACFYHCRQGKVITGCCSKGHVYNVHKDECERRMKSFKI